MKYWDTSALVPLIFVEPQSRAVRHLIFADDAVTVSFLTRIELSAAIARRLRQHPDRLQSAAEFADTLENSWVDVDPHPETLQLARRLAFVHRLRAGDAVQLACAIIASSGSRPMPFVTLDAELAAAARTEGFPVLPSLE